jgi:hypothetical protein
MTSERRTVVVVVLMLLGAGGVGLAVGALTGRSDRTSAAQAVLGADTGGSPAATASEGAPGRGEWTATLAVPPGSCVVAASERSRTDGAEVAVDTKRVTVSGR